MKDRKSSLPGTLGMCFVAIAGLLLSGMAQSAPPVVKTVPWVASNPLIPHDIFSGVPTLLKGASDMDGATQYTWDFGDGSPVVTGPVTNKYVIEAMHTYTGAVGTIFTATLTVENTGTAETGTSQYFVQIRDVNLETEVNVAIDEGLWWLHKTRIDTTCSGLPCSHWSYNYTTRHSGYAATVGSSVNAFEANGHLESGDSSNPYVETVQRGLRYLMTLLVSEAIPGQPAGNPDSNGNGIGIRVDGSRDYPYASGIVMDAIITSGTPAAIATTGPTNVIARSYGDIIQDMVDSYAFGQFDSGPARGGWRYAWNTPPDNSAAQWGAIGLMPAEDNFGATVPAWVKTENQVWLAYSQYYPGYAPTLYYYGAFGYTGKGVGVATTASGMVQLAFDEVPTTDGRWQAGETYLGRNWNSFFTSGADYYAMFAMTKAMRQAVPNPVVDLCDGNALCASIDWYNDATNGFARRLVNKQNADGSWSGGNRSYIYNRLSTPWSVLILSKSLFEAGSPVAVANAIPNPAVAGQTITLDGSASFHQDAAKSIVMWEWDFENDGVFDATGPVATISFPALGDYPVALRVTDDGDPVKTDDTIVTVRVTIPPLAPSADANGPYVFCPQAQPWFLDGTGSVNPDEGVSEPGQPGDTIQQYAWELDSDNGFDDAFGPQPDVTAFFTALGLGDYLIQLRVTDTTATSFPSSGMGDLSDTGSAQVGVRDAQDVACGCIDDLYARPKSGKIQLVWSDTGADHYNVYRSTTSGGPYMFIAATTSTYSTYLDTGLMNGTTYYYVVRPAAINTDELCQSNEVSATPQARRRR